MSQSSSLGETPVAGALGMPPRADPSAEIEAELRDHLATAADRLHQQGLPPAAAQQKAQENFGDLTAISRRCYWIKQGDAVMFRSVIIALLSILCIALGITAIGSWRAQSRMAEQMGALAEQLRAVAESQRAAPTPVVVPETKPLEIAGKVYLGSPEKPAANTEVMICRVGDGEIVRRISTDQSGGYRSGPLAEGDYTVLAKEPKDAPPPRVGFQSAPIYLYPGTAVASVDFDVGQPKAQVAVSVSDRLPKLEVEGKYVIDSRLYFRVEPLGVRPTRWTARSPMPERWPLYISSPEASLDPAADKSRSGRDLRSYTVLSDGALSSDSPPVSFLGSGDLLTAGPYRVTASVAADIKPDGESNDVRSPFASSSGDQTMPWMSNEWVFGSYMGNLWQYKLLRQQDARMARPFLGNSVSSSTSASTVIQLSGGMLTRLRVEIPSDVVSRIQGLVDTITDANQFAAAVKKERPFIREAKVTVVGTVAVKESGIEAAGDSTR